MGNNNSPKGLDCISAKKKVFAYVALSLFHHYSRHETHYSCPSQAPLSPSWDTMVQCKVYTVLYSTGTP